MCIQLKSEFSSIFQSNPMNLPGTQPIPEKMGDFVLPQAYRDLMAGRSLAWVKQPYLASPEPNRYGLDQVFLPALGGFDPNPFWPGLEHAWGQAQEKGLPPYFLPFWQDQDVFFCFDFSQELAVTIRMVDSECAQWLVLARDFSDLFTQWQTPPQPGNIERLDLVPLSYLVSYMGQEDPATIQALVMELDFRQPQLCREILQYYAQRPDSPISDIAKSYL